MKAIIIGASVALVAGLGLTTQAQTGTVGRTFGDGGLPALLAVYDLNGDGVLSQEERDAMQADRNNRHERWAQQWDTNADGIISAEERQNAMDALKQRIEDMRQGRFAEADTNADGYLSYAEFSAIPAVARLEQAHPGAAKAIFDGLDTNHDGQLSPAEFLQHLRSGDRPPLEAQFKAADTNADGFLSLAEFSAMPEMVKLATQHPEAPQAIFTKLDANADGQLSLAEFMVQPPCPPPPMDPFAAADTNSDGFLSFAEFSAIPAIVDLAKMHPEAPQQVFDRLDANHDLKLSPAEFLLMGSNPPPPPPPPPGP